MVAHSSTLAWKIPWMEEPDRLQSMGSLRDMTEQLHFHFSLSCIGEGNGNSLQCSCLENPRGQGAWWAAVYGVTESQTRLKQLSSSSSSVCDFSVTNCTNPQMYHWHKYLWTTHFTTLTHFSPPSPCVLSAFLVSLSPCCL